MWELLAVRMFQWPFPYFVHALQYRLVMDVLPSTFDRVNWEVIDTLLWPVNSLLSRNIVYPLPAACFPPLGDVEDC